MSEESSASKEGKRRKKKKKRKKKTQFLDSGSVTYKHNVSMLLQ